METISIMMETLLENIVGQNYKLNKFEKKLNKLEEVVSDLRLKLIDLEQIMKLKK